MECSIYKPDDLQEAAALFYDVFTAPPWGYSWMEIGKVYSYFQDLADTPKFLGFVFRPEEGQKKITGVCLGSISDYFLASQYEIKEIFLQTGLQGHGLGSRFLVSIETMLRERGVDTVNLYTHKGISAYPFYLKNGYEVSPDTVMMAKFL